MLTKLFANNVPNRTVLPDELWRIGYLQSLHYFADTAGKRSLEGPIAIAVKSSGRCRVAQS